MDHNTMQKLQPIPDLLKPLCESDSVFTPFFKNIASRIKIASNKFKVKDYRGSAVEIRCCIDLLLDVFCYLFAIESSLSKKNKTAFEEKHLGRYESIFDDIVDEFIKKLIASQKIPEQIVNEISNQLKKEQDRLYQLIMNKLSRRISAKLNYAYAIGCASAHDANDVEESDAMHTFNDFIEVLTFVIENYFCDDGYFKWMMEHPLLELYFEPTLQSASIKCYPDGGGKEYIHELTVDKPIMLLESVYDDYKIISDKQKGVSTYMDLKNKQARDAISDRWRKRTRICFGETAVLMTNTHAKWHPNIDEFFAASVILKDVQFKSIFQKANAFAEIGCGTGFISSCIAKEFPNIECLKISDLDHRVADLAEFNVKANRATQKQEVIKGTGSDFMPLLQARMKGDLFKVDIIYSNPPYIIPSTHDTYPSLSITISTMLMERLILEFSNYSNILVLSYSSICEPVVKKLMEMAGVICIHKQERYVPFRLNDETQQRLKDEGLIIDLNDNSQYNKPEYQEFVKDNRGFRFWHRIICAVLKKAN